MKFYFNYLSRRLSMVAVIAISILSLSCNENQTGKINLEPSNTEKHSHSGKLYECAPCGCDSQGKVFKEPGSCPSCGMELREVKGSENSSRKMSELNPLKVLEKKMNVAIFLFDGNQVLDYAGPYDAFASSSQNFNVYTVGGTSAPIITWPNLSVNPQYNINNAPDPDIIIIPAGNNSSVKQDARDWIINNTEHADYLLSVCNGANLIAELGLLDGLEATAHKSGINRLEKDFPNIKKVHRDKRYVDNGKVITSGGVSAGIDASFYLMSKIIGVDGAQAAANSIEYIYWNLENNSY